MRRRTVFLVALLLVHGALGVAAIRAWIEGPFHGAAILDGGEVLAVARTGHAAVFDTKSPLYPWVLGRLLDAGGSVAWTAGLLGLLLSLAILAGIGALCRRLGAAGAAPWAMALYALSGSPLAMLTQPLPTLAATALLLGGSLAVAGRPGPRGDRPGVRPGDRPAEPAPARAFAGGALLGLAVLALAALLPAALLAAVAAAARGRRLAVACGALAAVAAGLLLFGARAWPEGSGLNLRLGNGAARSGTSDVRPGPAYDRLRLEPAFAAWQAGAAHVDADAFQRRALHAEISADPLGAAATVLRKLFLFWHRTEIVTDADFRHGLRGLAILPLLLLSFGVVAPLALAGLLRRRPALLALPVAGVLAGNLLYLTSARYRFPALPFLCVAAGLFLASRPRASGWLLAGLLGVALNLNLSGRALLWPGDGAAQEGRELLAQPGREEQALGPLQSAVAEGGDPRAHYDLGLLYERLAQVQRRGDLPALAEAQYREALRIDPLYPQAAENLMALLIARQDLDGAIALGREVVARNPYSGLARLNLAAALDRKGLVAEVRPLLIEGHRIAALAALAQNDLQGARLHALQLQSMAAPDARLQRLLDGAGG